MQVVAISISKKKGTRKSPVNEALLIAGHGVAHDAHAGDWHRQVSFLASESIGRAREGGLAVDFGDFAENIATRGIDWLNVPVGTRLGIGDQAEVQITQIGKECHRKCAIYYAAGDCIMPREGIFARVLKGGTVRVGDGIRFLPPPIVSIVSKKNSGKTTLLEKLIPELCRRGYRVGTVKHDHHGFDIDREGKDTWRHKQAGAATVVISSPKKIALVKDVDAEMDLDRIVTRFFGDMDLVLTEGYKQGGKPQIEVFRKAAHDTPLHTKAEPGTLIAVASDVAVDLGVPRLDVNDIQAIADFIAARFLTR